ncbi:MAG: T9SS type A sorting domain-containing protein [bacterium]|nr:T9SS type A sorting domain-containing protein [bacterium]
MNHKRKIFFLLLFSVIFICGWGASGHKIINRRSTFSLPPTMSFLNWADSLAAHSSDADYRRNSDPNEAPRHYIDIDDYPEFIATGSIPQNLDSLIALHGSSFVYDKGILPFSIMATTDSIKKYFQLRNFQKAMLHAADLGHYVGDGHNPLHITRNYDGQYTNQNGVHSRYETQLINRDSANIIYAFENAVYIQNINQFVFDFLYHNYTYVDSVLKYDSIAHAIAPSYNSTYYQIYWQLAGNFTNMLFNNASHFITSLVYTAWINSGSPLAVTQTGNSLPEKYYLGQNYPNPFNPVTKINFDIPERSVVTLKIFDMTGKVVNTLLNNEQLSQGSYGLSFDASLLPSGIYFYRLLSGNYVVTKKMILTK